MPKIAHNGKRIFKIQLGPQAVLFKVDETYATSTSPRVSYWMTTGNISIVWSWLRFRASRGLLCPILGPSFRVIALVTRFPGTVFATIFHNETSLSSTDVFNEIIIRICSVEPDAFGVDAGCVPPPCQEEWGHAYRVLKKSPFLIQRPIELPNPCLYSI
jgi:hypothetical protein